MQVLALLSEGNFANSKKLGSSSLAAVHHCLTLELCSFHNKEQCKYNQQKVKVYMVWGRELNNTS